MLAVKLPTTTAFSVGWKLALLLKIPTWGSGIRDSQILELEPVQRLRCRVSQSTPFMLALLFCTANGDISSMNHELLITKAKPPQETLSTKPANIPAQTPFHLVLHSEERAPPVPSVQNLQPYWGKAIGGEAIGCCTRGHLPLTALWKQVQQHRP